ncbi:hypothetical protein C0989_006666 [Termitomyces sp. Mn162]|nr:hypothetical protein C0989_006666 [Termitomyces sp. Mn162]
MSAPHSELSSGPARITLPTSGPLKSKDVLSKIREFEGRLEIVKEKLPQIENTSQLTKQVKDLMKKVDEQSKDIDGLKEENDLLKKEVEVLMSINAQVPSDDLDITSMSESESDEETVGLTKMEEEIKGSALAYSDNAFKELMHYAFNHSMGIGKFCEADPPPYPDTNNQSTWPHIPGTDDSVIQFRWNKPGSDNNNYYSIHWLMGWMKHHGADVVPNAKAAILHISDKDHQKRVQQQFTNLQRKIKNAQAHCKNKDVGTKAAAAQNNGTLNESVLVDSICHDPSPEPPHIVHQPPDPPKNPRRSAELPLMPRAYFS